MFYYLSVQFQGQRFKQYEIPHVRNSKSNIFTIGCQCCLSEGTFRNIVVCETKIAVGFYIPRGVDKPLARPSRKQATATKL